MGNHEQAHIVAIYRKKSKIKISNQGDIEMGIQDREWYQEAQRDKHKKRYGNQWNGNSQDNPFNKSTLLYLSLCINIMLGIALYYVAY